MYSPQYTYFKFEKPNIVTSTMESKPTVVIPVCKEENNSTVSSSDSVNEDPTVTYNRKRKHSDSGENDEDDVKYSSKSNFELQSLDVDAKSISPMDVSKRPPSNYKRRMSVLDKRRPRQNGRTFGTYTDTFGHESTCGYPSSNGPQFEIQSNHSNSTESPTSDCDFNTKEFWLSLFSDEDQAQPTSDIDTSLSYESYIGNDSPAVRHTTTRGDKKIENISNSSSSFEFPSLDLNVNSVPIMDGVFKRPPSNYKRKMSALQKRRLRYESFFGCPNSIEPQFQLPSNLSETSNSTTDFEFDWGEFLLSLVNGEQTQTEPTSGNESTTNYGSSSSSSNNNIDELDYISPDIVPFNFNASLESNTSIPQY